MVVLVYPWAIVQEAQVVCTYLAADVQDDRRHEQVGEGQHRRQLSLAVGVGVDEEQRSDVEGPVQMPGASAASMLFAAAPIRLAA